MGAILFAFLPLLQISHTFCGLLKIEKLCKDIRQLFQHPQMQPIMSRGPVWVRFSQLISNFIFIHCFPLFQIQKFKILIAGTEAKAALGNSQLTMGNGFSHTVQLQDHLFSVDQCHTGKLWTAKYHLYMSGQCFWPLPSWPAPVPTSCILPPNSLPPQYSGVKRSLRSPQSLADLSPFLNCYFTWKMLSLVFCPSS